MYKKNKNIVECPIHGLHFDKSKMPGCALCIRDQKKLEELRVESRKAKSGLLPITLASVALAFIVWAVLYFVFPPPAQNIINFTAVALTYSAPSDWHKTDRSALDIALDRMGLRTEESKWKMEAKYTSRSPVTAGDEFLEYIQVMVGDGAMEVDRNSIPIVEKKILELKPNAFLSPAIISSGILQVGNTLAVETEVMYESEQERYKALVYYVPAGIKHYWLTLAATPQEWANYIGTFTEFIDSVNGGMQGKGKNRLPGIFFSPRRAFFVAIIVFIVSLWGMTMIHFSQPQKKRKKPSAPAKPAK